MNQFNGIAVLGTMLLASGALAQDFERRAVILGGDPFRGKCVVEVVVDGAAEVDIRGDGANLRTLAGRPAEWRRFECTAPMPRNPAEFRFAGIGGRGRQQLIRPAVEDGPAAVRIDDPQGGAGTYVFETYWAGRGGGDRERREEGPPPATIALRRCQERVQDRMRDDGWHRVEIRRIHVDDEGGRRDWIVGRAVGERGDGPRDFEFSCNVDLRDGDVRSVDVRRAGERR